MASSSFGKWYEDQKNADTDAEQPQSGLSSSFSGILGFGGTSASETADQSSSESSANDTDGGNTTLPLFGGDVGSGLSALKTSFEQQFPARVWGMNYQERFRMFCALLCLSGLFFGLGFAVGLPMITLRPQKFALCFTFGSLAFMMSFAILKGPNEHFMGMLESDRLLFTTIYFGSMLATLYFTFSVGGVSGYFTVLASSGLQIMALLWYLISFIPGGAAGMSVLFSGILKMLKPLLVGCAKIWKKFITSMFSWVTQ